MDQPGPDARPANPTYGYCNWFLNTPGKGSDGSEGARPFPFAPPSSVTFQGNGVNIVYLDWENDLVVVGRWIDGNKNFDQFLGKVIGAVK